MILPGHTILSQLGKKHLRPGGKVLTQEVFSSIEIDPSMTILEVACNQGMTSMWMAEKYGAHIVAVDIDQKVLDLAQSKNAHPNIQYQRANALRLPFHNQEFDILVNEAMLTMMPYHGKKKIIQGYHRVLKDGGYLLTHDISYVSTDFESHIQELSDSIHMPVNPLLEKDWIALFEESGFEVVKMIVRPMTLLSFQGMISDEGIFGSVSFITRMLKSQYKNEVLGMRSFFKEHQDQLRGIGFVLRKIEGSN